MHYTGWLYDAAAPETRASKFDSSLDRNEPFEFTLGAGHGHQGLGRRRGRHEGRRQAPLVIPPDIGYGARGAGGVIPPNATLVFDVELVEIH